mmetsp:Transcript_35985/g.52753  ORF Transcript_35985/g.52753 Transcript_35985/m.52753 type:complete len:166 (+) Transcript_35985:199-696(+)
MIKVLLLLLVALTQDVTSFTPSTPPSQQTQLNALSQNNSRRTFFTTLTSSILLSTTLPTPSSARYILNEETGDYEEVSDADWQTTWKQRLDKAQSMSTDEVFMAARGAANTQNRELPESDAFKKRRALSGCRDKATRSKVDGGLSEKDCNTRVLGGDVDFILNGM